MPSSPLIRNIHRRSEALAEYRYEDFEIVGYQVSQQLSLIHI